jgi:mannose-1-phosphate guanylyltransferase / mannose-6-phosphate isomerase
VFPGQARCCNPGGQLSLRMDPHRAEHWIVVKGPVLGTNDSEEFMLTENQSTYIPLELIEVRLGTCLGEGDIVRFEYKYGRAAAS